MGERVALRKAGRAYKGLCPFHAEKTPSFTVDPERRTYHCFACGEHGDCFTWLEKQDGLEPVEALRVLAERAGVELTRRAPEEREYEQRLLSAQETAHFYFRQALRGTALGKAAAAYLAKRGVTPESVEHFGIGYAPDLRDGLLAYLRKKGFTDEEAIAAGLIVTSDRGLLFDRFRDRLIVPIRDAKGRIIAFGGRAMRADQPAKYVNSPQTVLFNKSATLYALDVARPAIRKENAAVIVEGYFDAIASHQAGFANVIASMGTALTEDQYRVLDDMKVERAVVAFDGDAAGQRSAESRGRDLARQVQRASQRAGRGAVAARTGLAVYVTVLPDATDPDELARSDPRRLRSLISGAKPVLEFLIERIASRTDLAGPDGRRKFLAQTLPLLADEPDALTRELYLGTLSRLTGVEQEALRAEAAVPVAASRGRSVGQPTAPATSLEASERASTKQTSSLERYVMALLTRFPEEAARADLVPSDLVDPDLRATLELLQAGRQPTSDFPAQLAAVVAALGAAAPEIGSEADPGRAIEIAALRLREASLRRRLGDARAQLARAASAEEGGDVGGLDALVTTLVEELEHVMRVREQRTVLRGGRERE